MTPCPRISPSASHARVCRNTLSASRMPFELAACATHVQRAAAHASLQVFSNSPELQVVTILFEDAGISDAGMSGAVLQDASDRDVFNVNGVDLASCTMLKSAVRTWKQCPADAIMRAVMRAVMRAAAIAVRASGGAPAGQL